MAVQVIQQANWTGSGRVTLLEGVLVNGRDWLRHASITVESANNDEHLRLQQQLFADGTVEAGTIGILQIVTAVSAHYMFVKYRADTTTTVPLWKGRLATHLNRPQTASDSMAVQSLCSGQHCQIQISDQVIWCSWRIFVNWWQKTHV